MTPFYTVRTRIQKNRAGKDEAVAPAPRVVVRSKCTKILETLQPKQTKKDYDFRAERNVPATR